MKDKKKKYILIILGFFLIVALAVASPSEPPIVLKGWVTFNGPDWECTCPQKLYYDCFCIVPSK